MLKIKTAWVILGSLFVFDNLISYYAISEKDAKEVNLLIAPIVEKYPLLYFICIPLTILIMYFLLPFFHKILSRFNTNFRSIDKTTQKKILLTSFVIFWLIANSSINLIFLSGLKLPVLSWSVFLFFGSLFASIYYFLTQKRL